MSIQAIAWVLEHETTTTGTDRLVLLALANHAGWHDGRWECWPSRERIAHEANVSRIETVKDALRRLERAGLIERHIKSAPDDRIPARYRPNLYVLVGVTAEGTRDAPSQRGRATAVRGDAERASEGTRDVSERGRGTPPKPLDEPLDEPPLEPRAVVSLLDQEFDAFWGAYPRRTGKGAARTAFAKARAKAPLSVLVHAAIQFATDPNRDPEFTPHPATWLNQERWDDDPLPARAAPRPSPRQGQGFARMAIGLMSEEHTNGNHPSNHQVPRSPQRERSEQEDGRGPAPAPRGLAAAARELPGRPRGDRD